MSGMIQEAMQKLHEAEVDELDVQAMFIGPPGPQLVLRGLPTSRRPPEDEELMELGIDPSDIVGFAQYGRWVAVEVKPESVQKYRKLPSPRMESQQEEVQIEPMNKVPETPAAEEPVERPKPKKTPERSEVVDTVEKMLGQLDKKLKLQGLIKGTKFSWNADVVVDAIWDQVSTAFDHTEKK